MERGANKLGEEELCVRVCVHFHIMGALLWSPGSAYIEIFPQCVDTIMHQTHTHTQFLCIWLFLSSASSLMF